MKSNNEMFLIKNTKKAILNGNETSSKTLLNAENVDEIIASNNKAGLVKQAQAKKKSLLTIIISRTFFYFIAPLLVGWCLYFFGWK